MFIIKFFYGVYRKFNTLIYTWFAKKTLGILKGDIKVNGFSKFTKNCVFGHNLHFNGLQVLGGGRVEIGNNFHSGPECQFITQNHNINGSKIPYDNTYIIKNIVIGDNVWLGSRVTILGGVTIGEGAVIQAGSVVVKNIPAYSIAGGHPCKPFAERDKEKYLKLKEEGMFH
tara:strand:- start:4192 stop:4704 length:513 start_codon:yes stop_codon:yes gene_type:complete